CATAGAPRNSAGPAAASAAPVPSTVRRSISPSLPGDCLAISPSTALREPRSSVHLRLQTSFGPGQGNRPHSGWQCLLLPFQRPAFGAELLLHPRPTDGSSC